MNEEIAVRALSALAQEARLRCFRALVRAAPKGLTPGELSTTLDVPSSTLSFHLKELVAAKLLVFRREGRRLIYQPDFTQMNALLAYLTDHCCEGSEDASANTRSSHDIVKRSPL